MSRSVFRILNFNDFADYVRHTNFQRKITFIQNHHTWKPDYNTFYKSGHSPMQLLENMRNDHIQSRGWRDIGQNLTIFPDGTIGLCRSFDTTPAGIFGANTGGICIENFGNFDNGKDVMSDEQGEAIVLTNAILCLKFGLKTLPNQVVYHHWYDTKGKRFSIDDIDSGKVLKDSLQKTCPGTNFFSDPGPSAGNTIKCAIANFYPLINTAIRNLSNQPAPIIQPELKRVAVNLLNVRGGRGVDFKVIRQLPKGLQIQVFNQIEDWAQISINVEEWVSAKLLA